MELGADVPRGFFGDEDILEPSEGFLNPGAVELDPIPLRLDPGAAEEEYREALEAFQRQLQSDPLWYFLTVYAGGRKEPSVDRLMQKSGRIPQHLLDLLDRISSSDLKREKVEAIQEEEEEVGFGGKGEARGEFRLDLGDNAKEDVARLVDEFVPRKVRMAMGANTAKDDYEEWTSRRWDVLVPQVFASAEAAVDELIGEYKEATVEDPNFFISHPNREVRRAFALLTGKLSLRTDFFAPTRASFDKNLGRLNSEIYGLMKNRAFKELFAQ